MRYLATIEYVGTNYAGWQIQPNGVSIEEEIEKVLSRILNRKTKIYGSGRTDAGVHAHGQTFHFDAFQIKDLGKFLYSLNSLLPSDMHVLDIRQVRDDFNARYDAKSKTYSYYFNMGEYDPFERDKMYQFLRKLDVTKMMEALDAFKGTHNFQNFTSKPEDMNNYVRTIHEASIEQVGDIIKITFTGNGFMRYMVRMMVGALIEVGLGKLTEMQIKILLVDINRKVVSYKAPANGLYLEKVTY